MEVKFEKAAKPEIIEQKAGFVGMCEHIARCAAVCYDSVPKTGGAAVDFVKSLHRRGHGRTLEFGTIYLKLRAYEYDSEEIGKFYSSPYAISRLATDGIAYITTNLRFILGYMGCIDTVQEKWGKGDIVDYDAKYSFAHRPTIHYPAISRAIADEFRTHTTLSSLMRSTRYTGAGRKGAVAILPSWCDYDDPNNFANGAFKAAVEDAYDAYERLTNDFGCSKEQARDVLPLCAATEMVQCGFVRNWENFIRLRTDEAAHPDARKTAEEVEKLMQAKQWVK